jgi:two-component system response regulator ChvI
MTLAVREHGHLVVQHADGAAALTAFRAAPPDLVLAALKAPGVNGHEILRHVRRISPIPVVLFSPRRDEIDEMIALKLGADDFLSGSPSPAMIAARVNVILRRALPPRLATPAAGEPGAPLRYGGLAFGVGQRSCALDGQAVDLTPLEIVMLKALLSKPGAVLSRERLTDLLYGPHADMDPRIVDSHVKRLRTKFRAVSPRFDPIETIYRAGYRLRFPIDGAAPRNPPNSEARPRIRGQIR